MSGELVEEIGDAISDAARVVREYLASPRGRRMRARVATGLILSAPLIARFPVVKASRVGRVLGVAGGAALLVKLAELIRDWDPGVEPIISS
jgi:hypothetical protein